ncbi:MAG: right-handed parallel beta-helix repeat-containing protein [Planctomycetota bacterium]|jgi:hypothetical protein
MTAKDKQTLLDYFANSGRAKYQQSEREEQFEDLIDSIAGGTTLTVAANDAADASKAKADYVCDGTADDVQIQAAIDALPTVGGRVLLSEGVFTLASSVKVATDTSIIGQGYATKIDHPAALIYAFTDDGVASPDDVLIANIRFVAAGSRTAVPVGIDLCVTGTAENVIIRNCWFDDYVYSSSTPSGVRGKYDGLQVINCIFKSANGTGNSHQLYISDTSENVVVQGCTFLTSFQGNCIYAAGTTQLKIIGNNIEGSSLTPAIEGIDIEGGSEVSIVGNAFYNLSIDGILVGGGPTFGGTTDIVISGNTFNACGKTHASRRGAISIGPAIACTRVLIVGNTVTDCNAGIARLGETGSNIANEALVIGNVVESCTYPSILFGNNYDLQICNNWFRSNTNPISTETGTLKAYNNDDDYITENSGTSSITSGQTTKVVAHGLDSTPTVVNIAFLEQGTNDYGRWWVSALGSTGFTLNVTADPGASNLDFGWEAKVR